MIENWSVGVNQYQYPGNPTNFLWVDIGMYDIIFVIQLYSYQFGIKNYKFDFEMTLRKLHNEQKLAKQL